MGIVDGCVGGGRADDGMEQRAVECGCKVFEVHAPGAAEFVGDGAAEPHGPGGAGADEGKGRGKKKAGAAAGSGSEGFRVGKRAKVQLL